MVAPVRSTKSGASFDGRVGRSYGHTGEVRVSTQFSEQGFGDFVGQFEFQAEVKKAPVWPLIVSVSVLMVSLLLIVVERGAVDSNLLIVALIGYVLTPLAAAFLLIVAKRSHKNLSSVNGYQEQSGTRLIKYCSLVAWSGFVLAIPHVWQIAHHFSLVFAPGAM